MRVTVYDLWNLTTPTLPPRSRLFSLPPIGTGTSQVESLTSYIMRLAESHTVSVRTLITREIFPHLPNGPKDTTFEKLHSLNGMGSCFEQWVKALGKLTARNDLRALTLLRWQNTFYSGGVLRRHRTWCPLCFQKWRDCALPIYECLLWGLTPVTVCPIHEVSLEEQCPHCKQPMLPLSAHARPGFCAQCNRWVGGHSTSGLNPPTDDQLWLAKTLGNLLAFGGTTNSESGPRYALHNLQRILLELADGNQRLLGRVARISAGTPIGWLRRDSLPSLPSLIRICQTLRLPITRLVSEEITEHDPDWVMAKQIIVAKQVAFAACTKALKHVKREYPITRVVTPSKPLSPEERVSSKAEIKSCLQANLKHDEPLSIAEVFRKLGYYSPSRGRAWFPELCAATKTKREQRVEVYQQELRAALTEEPPPTVGQVALRLGIRVTQLRLRRSCRELCKALSSRYPDRRHFQRNNIEAALSNALSEPPVPLAALAARLQKNPDALRFAFPDLCRRLRARYVAHRSSERRQLRHLYECEVSQAVAEITDAGEYPSQQRVLSFIVKRNLSLNSFYLTGLALKSVHKRLG